MNNKIVINSINKTYSKNKILDNIVVECETGKITSFFGRNGSGKSSLLKIIFGTLKADNELNITINNEIFSSKNLISQCKIAFLPQESFLPKNLKIRNIIPLYYVNEVQQDKLFYNPRINNIQNKTAGNLSLGELRYLELMLVSSLSHPFLLLDEPFSMVEPIFVELIKEHLIVLKEKKGIILTDHYYADALTISDELYLIKESKKIIVKNEEDLRLNGYLPS